MLKIRHSYHGTGGKEGYVFKVYNEKGKKLGEIDRLPVECSIGDVVELEEKLYIITAEYESDNPRHELT